MKKQKSYLSKGLIAGLIVFLSITMVVTLFADTSKSNYKVSNGQIQNRIDAKTVFIVDKVVTGNVTLSKPQEGAIVDKRTNTESENQTNTSTQSVAEITTEKMSVKTINASRTVSSLTEMLENQKIGVSQNATAEQVYNYANPESRYSDNKKVFQFLQINRYREINESQLNEYLEGSGILEGKADVFIAAAKKYNVDAVYLVAHAIHETGRGTSALAKGISVDGVTVYNFWGIHAYDASPNASGSGLAADEKWNTVDEAIYGGTEWISKNYINAGQNFVYKMKFNFDKGQEWHGYATDIAWPDKIAEYMYEMSYVYSSAETFEFYKVIYDK